MDLIKIIESAWNNKELLKTDEAKTAIREVIRLLDKGIIRVVEPENGNWNVHTWIKKAIIQYFSIQQMEVIEAGPFEYFDKIP